MHRQLPITVVTYNGEFLEEPRLMYFDCDLIEYVGMYNARTYDANDCIIVRRAFGFLYGNDLWQTFDFKNLAEFIAFRDNYCGEGIGNCCTVMYNNCYVTYNGKKVVYGTET